VLLFAKGVAFVRVLKAVKCFTVALSELLGMQRKVREVLYRVEAVVSVLVRRGDEASNGVTPWPLTTAALRCISEGSFGFRST
jgi:hypothetical protein